MSLVNPFQFSSEYYDSELNLVYYNYRHYDPETGRWLSREPLEESGSINLYSFIKNNSLNTFDVLGLYGYNIHYEWTYLMALEMGYNSYQAQTIADGSWSADQGKFDAVGIGIDAYLNPFNTDKNQEGKNIQKVLHALNGLTGKQIQCFRKCIGGLMQNYKLNNDLYELGVTMHALSDTFGHLQMSNYSDEQSERLYDNSSYLGHAWDSMIGKDPDNVDYRPGLLKKYITEVKINIGQQLPYAMFYSEGITNSTPIKSSMYRYAASNRPNSTSKGKRTRASDNLKKMKPYNKNIDSYRESAINSVIDKLKSCFEKAKVVTP